MIKRLIFHSAPSMSEIFDSKKTKKLYKKRREQASRLFPKGKEKPQKLLRSFHQ